MKKLLPSATIAIISILILNTFGVSVFAGCKDTYNTRQADTTVYSDGMCSSCNYKVTKYWKVHFLDGYSRDVDPVGNGQRISHVFTFSYCDPYFSSPDFVEMSYSEGKWFQDTKPGSYDFDLGACKTSGAYTTFTVGHICAISEEGGGEENCPNGDVWTGTKCESSGGEIGGGCEANPYEGCAGSPILLDINGDGFQLTDAAGGVDFNLSGNGAPTRWSWTTVGSDDAWLALDTNDNNTVDSGLELFGNFTMQPQSDDPNGFTALAVYDMPTNGSNDDGTIDGSDAVYSRLRLWQDKNHNGVSEPDELHTLPSLNAESITLDYRESRKKDKYGNEFRYRAKVNGRGSSPTGKWAYDVFLTPGQ